MTGDFPVALGGIGVMAETGKRKAKYRKGQEIRIVNCPARIREVSKNVLIVTVAGYEVPVYRNEIRPLTAKEHGRV